MPAGGGAQFRPRDPCGLIRRSLLQALEIRAAEAIDEVDRADEEFELFLLEILSDVAADRPHPRGASAAGDPDQQPDALGESRVGMR